MVHYCNHHPSTVGECKPEELDLEHELQKIGFSKTQIDWVTEDLIKLFGKGNIRVQSIGQFSINSDYGFDNEGWATPLSKYNVCINFRELSYLLIKK